MAKSYATQTEAVVKHHFEAVAKGDVDSILSDYTETSLLMTPRGPVRGMEDLKKFFTGYLKSLPEDFMAKIEISRKDVIGQIGYVLWSAEPHANLGTDTFVVQNNKIVLQSFAAK